MIEQKCLICISCEVSLTWKDEGDLVVVKNARVVIVCFAVRRSSERGEQRGGERGERGERGAERGERGAERGERPERAERRVPVENGRAHLAAPRQVGALVWTQNSLILLLFYVSVFTIFHSIPIIKLLSVNSVPISLYMMPHDCNSTSLSQLP